MTEIETVEQLRALIREIADATADPGPQAVAEKVLGQLAPSEYAFVLAVTLPHYVSDLLRGDADRARRGIPADQMSRDTQSGRVGGEQTAGTEGPDQLPPDSQVISDGPRYLSRTVAALHQAAMRSPFYDHANGCWKRFGRCTADDLDAAAQARDEQAIALHVEAERWRRYAATMREHDWVHVEDIPVEIERGLGGGES